jgi:DNA polymerase-3 subunit delta'
VLASESSHQLLPTIRSRCMGHTMVWPELEQSLQWLQSAGLSAAGAQKALAANAGRPQDALEWFRAGRDPAHWAAFPAAMARGDAQLARDWSVQELVGALQKLCHDMLARAVQAEPRFFSLQDLGPPVSLPVLTQWSQSLAAQRRIMDHPFNAGLFIESLVCDAQAALSARPN